MRTANTICGCRPCRRSGGEKIVLRILDKNAMRWSLDEVVTSPEDNRKFRELAANPYGMLLLTGPTGSGKTTTLYSVLQLVNTPQRNIVTVEDPVEYRLPGITQVQVRPAAGVTFASSLRSILRQDPDIILIGEIRDLETAEIAISAALTGHLVLSTLHTNDAAGAVSRLINHRHSAVPGGLGPAGGRGPAAGANGLSPVQGDLRTGPESGGFRIAVAARRI